MSSSSLKRVQAAFNHTTPDRTPIFEYLLFGKRAEDILGHAFADYTYDLSQWNNYVQHTGLEQALKDYATNRIELAQKLGHDLLYVCPNPLPDTEYVYDPLVQVDDYFTINSIEDPVERLQLRNEKVQQTLMKKLPEACYEVYVRMQSEMATKGINLPIFAPAYFHGIWNDVDLMQTMLLDRDVAHTHFSLATTRAKHIIDDYFDNGIFLIGIGGDFAGNRPLISPEAYREFIVPEVRILADYVKAKDGFPINATDGNIWSVIDDFIVGCNVDGYMEIDSGAGMSLSKLKEAYGDVVVLMGNMDCGNTLTYSTPEEIAVKTHEILDAGYGNGGHIFTASNAITESIPLENYMAMVNAYREHFSLKPVEL